MGEWWYAEAQERKGPVDEAHLKTLLRTGAINAETLVWREGNEHWIALSQEPTLGHLLKTLPPPIPVEATTISTSRLDEAYPAGESLFKDDTAHKPTPNLVLGAFAWSRCFARIFDLWLAMLVVAPVLLCAAWLWPDALPSYQPSSGIGTLVGLVVVALALLLDAIVYAVFGNTPGKALLRIKVLTYDEKRPGFWQYARRNVGLWGSGLAFGFPVLNLFTMAYQHRALRRGRPATYDDGSFKIAQERVGFARRLTFLIAFIAVMSTMTVLSVVMDKVRLDADHAAVKSRAARSAPSEEHAYPAEQSVNGGTSSAGLATDACPKHFSDGEPPRIENPNLAKRTSVLCSDAMAVTYSAVTRTALWSAQHVTAEKLRRADGLEFTPEVQPETKLPPGDRTEVSDFYSEIYEKVALTPWAWLDTNAGRAEGTSLMNLVPLATGRTPELWKGMVDRAADLARSGADLYVLTGTLFEGSELFNLNGRILVPTALYIVYRDAQTGSTSAYVLENRGEAKVKKLSLESLQRRAGITFFPGSKPVSKEVSVRQAPKEAMPKELGVEKEARLDTTSCERPVYPASAARNGDEGTSVGAFLVDAQGRVLDSKIKRSSGHASLDEAFLSAMSACWFNPAITNGKAQQSWAQVRYVWTLPK